MKFSSFSLAVLVIFSVGCRPGVIPDAQKKDEAFVLDAAREIIRTSDTCALVTLDEQNLPQIRTMDPFSPEDDFTVWLATNPKSRKVDQIKNNPNVTLYYSGKNDNGYVSIYGKAELVNDQAEKNKRWKNAWKKFYPNRTDAYLLIKVVPTRLEAINYARGIAGDSKTWQPNQVFFKK